MPMLSASAKAKHDLIVAINGTTSASDICQVLGLGKDSTSDEVTRKRKELCLLIHPDKNPLQKEAAHSAFVAMQKGFDIFIMGRYSPPKEHDCDVNASRKGKSRRPHAEEQNKQSGGDEFPSRQFTRSDSSSRKRKYTPTDEEFDKIVENIDARASLWRSFQDNTHQKFSDETSSRADATNSPDLGRQHHAAGHAGVACGEHEGFVCMLCRRKFVSEGHMMTHLQMSKLHASLLTKSNL